MKKCRQIREQVLADAKHRPASVFRLLLDTAELELVVRELFRWLLAERQRNWRRDRADSVDRLTELADVYSGAKPLARVEKNGANNLVFITFFFTFSTWRSSVHRDIDLCVAFFIESLFLSTS